MHCRHVKLPNGNVAIVCGGGRERSHPCVGCAQHVGDDKDLCPQHQLAYKDWLDALAARVACESGSLLTPHRSTK